MAAAVVALVTAQAAGAQGVARVTDGPPILGEPFAVGGVTYTPANPSSYDEVGYASVAQGASNGEATTTGEAFAPAAITAAHKTLPLPSYAEVTALDTGRTILVRVNDRGPMSNGRVIALSQGAAEQLKLEDGAAVRVRRVNPPEQERAALRAGGRAAERLPTPAPLLKALRAKLPAPAFERTRPIAADRPAPIKNASPKSRPGADFDRPAKAPVATKPAAPPPPAKPLKATPPPAAASAKTGRFIVQLGAYASQARAEQAAKTAGAQVSQAAGLWRVRLGPYATREAAQAGARAAAAKGFQNGQIISNAP